eukprot:10661697-Lingulodinium_polyedra.AAC.1
MGIWGPCPQCRRAPGGGACALWSLGPSCFYGCCARQIARRARSLMNSARRSLAACRLPSRTSGRLWSTQTTCWPPVSACS